MTRYVDQPGEGGDRDTFEWINNEPYTGHAFVRIEVPEFGIDKTVGFYPSYEDGQRPKDALLGSAVKGKLRNDSDLIPTPGTLGNASQKVNVQKSFRIDIASALSALSYIDLVEIAKPDYDLSSYNCTDIVLAVARNAGLIIPDTTGRWPLGGGSNPGDLGEDLKELN